MCDERDRLALAGGEDVGDRFRSLPIGRSAPLIGSVVGDLLRYVGVVFEEETVVQTVAFLGNFPLAFGTNMVVPAETRPGWLQAWVDVNPVTHAMEASRGLLFGGPVAEPVSMTLLSIG